MKNLRAAFYTESGYSRGMGHLIRTFTISEKFKSAGVKVSLYLDSDISYSDKYRNVKYFSWKNFELKDHIYHLY